MRVYCWYKPLETAQIRRKKDGNSEVLLISLIRNVMISIICDFYVNSLTRKDFMSSNEFISTPILQLIVSLHSKKLISSLALYEHMVMILHNIKECRLTQEMLMKFATLKIGPDANLPMFIPNLSPESGLCSAPNWCIWPIIAAIHSSPEVMNGMLQFLAKCIPNELKTLKISRKCLL